MTSKVERNAEIGRIYYQALTDAAGYPNGMAYWPEMMPEHKYHEACTALLFLEALERAGYIICNAGIGLEPGAEYGKGDCGDLLEHFRATQDAGLEEFKQHQMAIQQAMQDIKNEHPHIEVMSVDTVKEVFELLRELTPKKAG